MYRHRQPTAAYRRLRPGKRRSWWPLMVALPLLSFMIVFLWGGPPQG